MKDKTNKNEELVVTKHLRFKKSKLENSDLFVRQITTAASWAVSRSGVIASSVRFRLAQCGADFVDENMTLAIEVVSFEPRPTFNDLKCAVESQIGKDCDFKASSCGNTLFASPKISS